MEALRPEDPRRLGPYRLRGRLGEGGMGEVFLGVSPSGLRAAVKTVRAEFAYDPGFRDRFRREVAAARRVDSAWTAPIAEADPDSDPPWFATEFLTGIPLSEAVATYGTLPERALRILAAQLVEALMAIHRAGLVHRDLKPSNVILGHDRPRVIDFGISRALDFATHGLTSPGGAIGSPGYMSPEQAAGEEVDQRSDIFALGGVLVYAATGGTPFGTTPQNALQLMFQIIHGEPRLDGVPEGLRDLVAECLAKDPARRPGLDDILRRTVGGADDAEAAVGGAWLPPALVAELVRRQTADPTDSLPPVPTGPQTAPYTPSAYGTDNDELPPTRAHFSSEGVTDVLPPPTQVAGGATAATAALPPPRPASSPTVGLTNVFEIGAAHPGPEPAPAQRTRGISRRTLLIGGSAAAVAAVGGVTAWALTRPEEESGRVAWSLPIGPTSDTWAVLAGKSLIIAGNGAKTKSSQVAASVVAVDIESGKRLWGRNTSGQNISRPVVGKDRVFIHSWTTVSDSSAPSKYHSTIYGIALEGGDMEPGKIVWQDEHDALGVQLAQTADEKLVVVVSPPNTTDTTESYVYVYDGAAGTRTTAYTASSTAPWLNSPCIDGKTAYVTGTADSYGDQGALYKVDIAGETGEVLWTAPKEQNLTAPAVASGRVYVRSSVGSASSSYAEERTLCAVRLSDGETDWRVTDIPAGSPRDLVVDVATNTVFVLTNGNDKSGNDKVDAWIQAFDATTGGKRWESKPEGLMLSRLTVGDGIAYVASWPSDLQSGLTKATQTPSATDPPTPAVAKGRIHALDIATGRRVWEYETQTPGALTTPQVAGGVVCVAASSHNGLVATALGLDAKTGKMRWKEDLTLGQVSGPLAAKGKFHLVVTPGEPTDPSATPSAATGSPSAAPPTGPEATAYELRPG